MLYTISNGIRAASIASLGAELKSLKDANNDDEYLWQGNAEVWQGSAPILFPIVGRLKNGEYQYQGKTYQLNKHGFARTGEFSVVSQQKDAVTFSLASNQETKQSYPFDFLLLVKFTLDKTGLSVSYTVQNTGADMMYFTLGSHPALSLPLENSRLEDYFVEFEQPETLDCYFLENNLLCDQPIKAYLNNQNTINISANLFKNDALIFKKIKSKKVSLKHRISGTRITMETGGAPYFGLWSKPGAAFICFEPWFSHDDPTDTNGELTTKPGILQLDPDQLFETEYRLQIG